jgi:ribosomal protein S6
MEKELLEKIEPKRYELGFLIPTEEAYSQVSALLAQHGARIVSEGAFKKLQLSYPIKKTVSAVFGFVHFEAEPAQVKVIEHEFLTKPFLLRSIILALSPKDSSGGSDSQKTGKSADRSLPTGDSQSEKVTGIQSDSSAVTNELLEKTIEEMLQEK